MKPTRVKVSDACECAFHGFALDVQDNGAGFWSGDSDGDNNSDDDPAQDAEATRTALKWAGWLGEDGELSDEAPFPDYRHLGGSSRTRSS